jgi:hypothetical protein
MDKLNLEYSKVQKTYWHNHWSDVLISSIILLLVFGGMVYSTYQSTLAQVRANWNQNKCSPIYLPFAGLIMPQPNKSALDATMENFDYCIQQDFSAVLNILMLPLEMVSYMIIDSIDVVLTIIAGLIAVFAWLKSIIGGIMETIFNKIIAIIIPIYLIVLKLRDALARMNGIMLVSLFTSMTIYNIMISGMINVMNIVYDLLIAVIVVIAALLVLAMILIPSPAFIEGLALFATATVALKIIVPIVGMYAVLRTFILQTFNVSTSNTPKVPTAKKKKKK